MAKKDTVYIDIQTSDGGSMQRVAVSAKKLGLALDDVGGASGRAGQGAKNADRNLKGLSKQSANSTKNFSKMAQGMTGTLVPAYAVLAANVFAITAAFAFLKKAADFRVMQESQVAFTGATGVGMQSLTANIQEASGAMLDFQSASESASIGIASGLGAGQIEQLAAGAGNLSKILGRDVTDSFNRLVRGVTKAEPELLDELGITLRLSDAQTKYAASIGKSVKDLTIYEKKQAVFVEVQGQLESKYNQVAKATDVQANAVAKLGVAFDKIMKVVKKYISIIAEPVAEFFTKNVGSMTAALALLAVPIVRSIIPGLDSWAEKSKESAAAAKEAYQNASDELDRLSEKQADIKSGKAIADTIDKPSAGIQAGFGPGKDKMSKASAAQLLRNATRTNKKLKHLDDKQLAAYRVHLKAQVRGHYTAMEEIYLQYLNLSRKLDVQTKKMVSRWELAMAVMKGATAKFTKGVDFLFKTMGLVGIALMVKDLGHDLLVYLGILKENKGLTELLRDMNALRDSTKTVIKEYERFEKINLRMREIAQADDNVTFDQLGLLAREGKMIESIGGQLLKNFRIKERELKLIEDTMHGVEDLDATEKARLQRIRGGIGVPGGATLASGFTADKLGRQLTEEWESKGGVKAATAAVKELQDRLDAYNAAVTLKEEIEKKAKETQAALTIENTKAATTMKEYIESLPSGQITILQEKYLEYLNIIAGGTPLVGEQIDKFERLTERIAEQGREAEGSKQALDGLNTQYETAVVEMTQFQTKHSELIRQYENEEAKLLQLDEARRKTKENQDLLKDVAAKLTHLNKLRDIEIKFALQKLKIDLATAKISRGATKYQKAELQRSNKILQNLSKMGKLEAEIAEAKDRDDTDERKVRHLQLQYELLVEQNKELERQRDLGAAVMDAMMQSIETNIQKTIADLLKGTESSLKDALLAFAKSVIDTMIDAFAQNITEKIMLKFMPGYQTQSMKMKAAVLEGAEEGVDNGALEIEKKIKSGMAAGTTDFIKALDDAAKRFAQAIKDACASCTCAGETMPAYTETPETGPKLVGKIPELVIPEGRSVMADGTFSSSSVIGEPQGAGGLLDDTPKSRLRIGEPVSGLGTRTDTTTVSGGEIIKVQVVDEYGSPVETGSSTLDSPMPGESIMEDPANPTYMDAAGEGEDERTTAIQENTDSTLRATDGLTKTATELLGNTKAGQALKTIQTASHVFNKSRALWDKSNAVKQTSKMGSLIIAINALTAAVKENTIQLSTSSSGSFFGGFGGGGGGGGGPPMGGKRGIYPPLGYAAGGLARGPLAGYPATLHGNEAVVPLPNGKDIPVTFPKGAGTGTQNNNVGITVNIDNQGQASTDTESDDQEAAMLGERLADLVQEELLNQKRAGGILSPYGVA